MVTKCYRQPFGGTWHWLLIIPVFVNVGITRLTSMPLIGWQSAPRSSKAARCRRVWTRARCSSHPPLVDCRAAAGVVAAAVAGVAGVVVAGGGGGVAGSWNPAKVFRSRWPQKVVRTGVSRTRPSELLAGTIFCFLLVSIYEAAVVAKR